MNPSVARPGTLTWGCHPGPHPLQLHANQPTTQPRQQQHPADLGLLAYGVRLTEDVEIKQQLRSNKVTVVFAKGHHLHSLICQSVLTYKASLQAHVSQMILAVSQRPLLRFLRRFL